MAERDLTLAEVAERRNYTPRYLRSLIRRYKIPVLGTGRMIRFDALALRALEEALRCPAREDCASPAARIPARSRSLALSRGSAFDAALSLTTVDSPKKKPLQSRQKSSELHGTGSVVALDRSGRR